jgi:hypothetical protein
MTIYYIYTLGFVALSGLGIVFLNPESILAFCFFIFFALILQNAQSAGQSLEDTRQAVQAELVSCMLDAQKHDANKQQLHIFQKAQLLQCVGHLKR